MFFFIVSMFHFFHFLLLHFRFFTLLILFFFPLGRKEEKIVEKLPL